jgi:hypothetical protein
VLRHTGIRIEELTELSHHSLIQYRLPSTNELIPLLQIAPSKTDAERLLVISPELADVLSTIVARVRSGQPHVPSVVSYDKNERVYNAPMPLLFQWRRRLENRPVSERSLRSYLDHALTTLGIKDAGGRPTRYTFHDFRRLFTLRPSSRGKVTRTWSPAGEVVVRVRVITRRASRLTCPLSGRQRPGPLVLA